MNKKEFEIAEKSFDIIEKCKDDLLKLCDGQSVSMTLSVLITSADYLIEVANEIEERHYEQKEALDLIWEGFEETLK